MEKVNTLPKGKDNALVFKWTESHPDGISLSKFEAYTENTYIIGMQFLELLKQTLRNISRKERIQT